MSESGDTLLEFPCRFPIKAFGKDDHDFAGTVYHLIKPHAPELMPDDLSSRHSSGGRYLAVTAEIRAVSQAQLDAIYTDLSASDAVIMSL